jgi:hypothetical protein
MPRVLPIALTRRNTKWSFVFLYLYRGNEENAGFTEFCGPSNKPIDFFSKNVLSTYFIKDEI